VRRERRIGDVNYPEWKNSVSSDIRSDSLWKMEVYRLGLFAADIGWHDVTRLLRDRRTLGLSDQLYRSLGSISANLAEGYSRGTGKDRARFYEYALGSTRESRDWYYQARHILEGTITEHRIGLLTQICRLLLTMIPQQRGRALRDQLIPSYQTTPDGSELSIDSEALDFLFQDVPLP
jgi:four helix bundle protein